MGVDVGGGGRPQRRPQGQQSRAGRGGAETRWGHAAAGVPGSMLAPTIGLMLVAIGGRYSLDRVGISWLAWLDLRLVGLLMVFALLAFDLRQVRGRAADWPRPEGWLVAALLFFGYQTASGLWAPPDAQVWAEAVDLLCMALLTVGLYLNARRDPVAVARRVLWFIWVTATVFAIGAFALGAGAQGRFAAFGGGPNVFVRIEVLGLIAALALVLIGAPRWVLYACPLLLVSAVLSGSRGGLLAGIVVALILAVFAGRRFRRAAIAATVAAGAVTFAAYLTIGSVRQLIDTRFIAQTVQQGDTSSRPAIWSQALSTAVNHPLIGVGVDGWRALVGVASGTDYPHNYLLAVAAEGGLVGLTLLGVTAALWIGTLRRAVGVSVELVTFTACAGYVAIASMTSGDYYDARLMWCFAAVAAALATARPGACGKLVTLGRRHTEPPVEQIWAVPTRPDGHAADPEVDDPERLLDGTGPGGVGESLIGARSPRGAPRHPVAAHPVAAHPVTPHP